MSFVAGLAALVVLAYQYFKKQKPQGITVPVDSLVVIIGPVSYTHLDVYKRQSLDSSCSGVALRK